MKRCLIIFLSILSFLQIDAKVQLPSFFADNMVLQQQTQVAVWGWADPDATVVISTTWSNIEILAVAGDDGKWFARVATPAAGGPYEITFNDGENVTLKNVLIGEVWICAGQSNMEMPMKGFKGQPTAGSVDYILNAKPSTPIRSCNFKRTKSFEPQEDCTAEWYEHTPDGVSNASATAYFFAKRLYDTIGIPVGIINVSWGGTPIEAWMSEDLLRREFSDEVDMSVNDMKKWPEKNAHRVPSVCYNGMLNALVPFTAKGFIWYQGCSNLGAHNLYKRLQPAFVKMLREKWRNDQMPFYFTQIAPYKYGGPDKPEGGYMMWAQAQTLDVIPYSGMATTHDAGELACIHPANKKVVGERLSYLALVNDYKVTGFDAKAPIARTFEFKDGMAFVTFEVGKMGLSPISTDLDGFELAGEDGVFYPAKARLLGGDRKKIKVYQCPEVPNPVAVRYGMKNWSEATLFNCFGVPASPFRSDDWE